MENGDRYNQIPANPGRAVIVPATCSLLSKPLNEMKYNRCEDLHQDAEVRMSERTNSPLSRH